MSGVKPYSSYRPSGKGWLGEVPEHWDVRRLGTTGRFFKGNGGTKADETEGGLPCVRYGDLYTRHEFFITESKACVAHHRAAAYTRIRYGDVLFAGSGETLEEIGKSAVNLISGSAVCGGDVIVFRPTIDLDAKFIGWSTDCRQAVSQKACMGRGITVMHIYSSELKRLLVPLPPLPEQTAIARFLNHADRRIRRYIRAKERLIKLLEEQKQAIIHQAVTGQIDFRTGQPYPAYKDSGVEWLGEVPEQWQRRAVGQLFQIGRGKVTSHEYITDHPGPFPLYSSQTENQGVMGYIDTFLFDGHYLTWTTDGAHAGTVFLRTGRFSCTNVCGTLYPKTRMSLGFMCMAVGAQTKRYVRLDINPKLMNNTMSRIRISVPPLDEQEAIAEYVQGIREPTDLMIGRANLQINLLREYRTRLIADVVTGKLDVREAAAALPDIDPFAAEGTLKESAEPIAEPQPAILPPHP